MANPPSANVFIPSASAHAFVTAILSVYGVPADRAVLIADSLVLADLRGVDTHGINRLGGYVERVKHGVLAPNPDHKFDVKSAVMALLDAQNTFGFVAAALAIDKAAEMAATHGIGVVAVRHSNHYGMAAT
jgi:LDH2 family malate/lactate/ureidoglycolate dehydrogenase